MATSPNYAWAEPDNSSLVKNGASDIRTLGDAIDTSVWNVGFGQAGKNKIINGDFGVWQRGTTFTTAFGGSYNVDRWKSYTDTAGATITVSRESLNNAIAGLNTRYFWQWNQTVAGSGGTVNYLTQPIENVETFANQNVVLSFYTKANTTIAMQTPVVVQRFGSGGSGAVTVTVTPAATNPANITTAWQRFSFTASVPSVAGKTIGAGSLLEINLKLPINSVFTIGIVGVQLEAGSTATPFQTASGGSPQAELAMCQRYYFRTTSSAGSQTATGISGITNSITNLVGYFTLPVPLRVSATAIDFSNIGTQTTVSGLTAISAVTFATDNTATCAALNLTSSGFVANTFGLVRGTTGTGYIGLSAEL